MSDETTVVVDVHEPGEIRMLTLSHPDVDSWLEHGLDSADIVVNGVGFERKTPSDFASSMLEDRLDEQVLKLNDAYDRSAILIEGGFDGFSALDHTALTPQSLRGKAASIHMRHGIPVIPTGGTTGTETAQRLLVDYAVRLGRKATEEPSSDYLRGSVVGSDEPLGKRLWGCFDGIGPELAGRLYGEVGSPVDVIEFDPDEGRAFVTLDRLEAVAGIGVERADSIVRQLEGEEDQTHMVYDEID